MMLCIYGDNANMIQFSTSSYIGYCGHIMDNALGSAEAMYDRLVC